MVGNNLRRKAVADYKKWQSIRFESLKKKLLVNAALVGKLSWPVHWFNYGPGIGHKEVGLISVSLYANADRRKQIAEEMAGEYERFFTSASAHGGTGGTSNTSSDADNEKRRVIFNQDVFLRIGSPSGYSYPFYLSNETANFADAVYRGEVFAYNEYERSGTLFRYNERGKTSDGGGVFLPSPSRWLKQEMLDGEVFQHVSVFNEKNNVTSDLFIQTYQQKKEMAFYRSDGGGKSNREAVIPPQEVSPFYAFCKERPLESAIFGPEDSDSNSDHSVLGGGNFRYNHKKLFSRDSATGNESYLQYALSVSLANSFISLFNNTKQQEHANEASSSNRNTAFWLNGSLLINKKTNRCVWVCGRERQIGKTTAALHAVEAIRSSDGPGGDVGVVALENFMLAPAESLLYAFPSLRDSDNGNRNNNSNNSSSAPGKENLCFLCGLPSLVNVNLGTFLGTLKPNGSVGKNFPFEFFFPHFFSNAGKGSDTSAIKERVLQHLLQNSERSLWHMNSKHYPLSLEQEIFNSRGGKDEVWFPSVVSQLAGIVYLDWDTESLASTHIHGPTRCSAFPLEEQPDFFLREGSRHSGGNLIKSHYIVKHYNYPINHKLNEHQDRSESLITDLTNVLTSLNENSAKGTSVFHITGSVNFDCVTELIVRALSGPPASVS